MARGHHIFVERVGGLYSHHGIDCGDGSVIHYNGPDPLRSRVQRCSMAEFLCGDPLRIRRREASRSDLREAGLGEVLLGLGDHVRRRRLECVDRSPDAVVARAESRLGEGGFDFLWNNCEHFASWCRTGTSRSAQSERVLWPLLGILEVVPALGFSASSRSLPA